MFYPRTIHHGLEENIRHFPVVVLTGPRQTGKSTEVWKLKEKGFQYVSLDNLDERSLALNDPKFFLTLHPAPIVIDEIQYAPILMEAIEEQVNQRRLEQGDANGMFVLTGSQSFQLMKGITQSLAGRACIMEMTCLSARELQMESDIPFLPGVHCFSRSQEKSVSDLYQSIVRGFFPELHRNPQLTATSFYDSYIRTYIERDVSDLIQPSNKLLFKNFMEYLASITSSQLNYAVISRAIGIDPKTVQAWISILETSGIIYLLQPYSEEKLTKRIVKSPKIYFCDTGLAAHLAKIYSPDHLAISSLAGAYMENYVINEIRKSYLNCCEPLSMYYYRDNNQNEIDLVLVSNRTLYRIEIKKGVSFNHRHVSGFRQLDHSELSLGPGAILCNTPKPYAIERDIFVLPYSCI
ncbi:ATP-binding protein [Allobaculum sp. JKK-2023]|uniref:ATP-binding protein n=1 Tax=Allobaculum sp. JKK-2023 TaxID=3108943 RepID=UPI002B060AC7|nr:ATP-binding protein [Allobaculum sp. JKK-2023]